MSDLANIPPRNLGRAGALGLPAAIGRASEKAAWRFVEFFTANIRNCNTRAGGPLARSKVTAPPGHVTESKGMEPPTARPRLGKVFIGISLKAGLLPRPEALTA
jgi:hypothetical protein